MSPTGETPAAEPTTTVKLPDAVSLKMLETENAILRRRLDECRPYLKDGETPAQCIKRNRADVDVALGLLAKEKQKAESAAPSAGPDVQERTDAEIARDEVIARAESAESSLSALREALKAEIAWMDERRNAPGITTLGMIQERLRALLASPTPEDR